MRLKYIASTLVVLLAMSAKATIFVKTNDYAVAKDQTISNEAWIVANSLEAGGTFQNDLFASSTTTLKIPGTCEGNVWGMAGTEAVIEGTCQRNVRLVAQTVLVNGTVKGNLAAMANTISISTNTTIKGDVLLFGNQVIVEGNLEGALDINSKRTVTISGTIKGDVQVTAPEIILSDDAHLQGNLTYTTAKELVPAEHVVEGKMHHNVPASPYSAARLQRHGIFYLSALLTGVAFISMFPMTTAMASLLARKSPLKCMAVGLLAVVILFVFALVAIDSLIGLPLGLVILASWGILIYTSRIIIGLMIGTLVLKTGNSSAGRVLLSMATGLAIIYFLTFISSGIGHMVQLIVACTGVGAQLLALLQKRRLIIQVPEELKQLEALKNQQNKPTEDSR